MTPIEIQQVIEERTRQGDKARAVWKLKVEMDARRADLRRQQTCSHLSRRTTASGRAKRETTA